VAVIKGDVEALISSSHSCSIGGEERGGEAVGARGGGGGGGIWRERLFSLSQPNQYL
jgi:hypothetical protein